MSNTETPNDAEPTGTDEPLVRLERRDDGVAVVTLDNGKVNALAVFTTEGQLSANEYKVLADPSNLFAFQHLAPVVRRDLARKYGARLTGPLDALSKRLTTDVMRRMNAAVDLKGEKPAAVAARFIDTGSPG